MYTNATRTNISFLIDIPSYLLDPFGFCEPRKVLLFLLFLLQTFISLISTLISQFSHLISQFSHLTAHISNLSSSFFIIHYKLSTYLIFFGGTTLSFSSNPLISQSFATSDCLLINISCAAVVMDSARRFRTSICNSFSFLANFS